MSLRTTAITDEDADAVVEIGTQPVALIPLTKSYGPLLSGSASVLNDTLASSARLSRVPAATLSGRLQTRFRL